MFIDTSLTTQENKNQYAEQNKAMIAKITTAYPNAFKPLDGHDNVLFLDRPAEVNVREIPLGEDGASMDVDTVFLSPENGFFATMRRFLKLPPQGEVNTNAYDQYKDMLRESAGKRNSIEQGFKEFGERGFNDLKNLFVEVNVANATKETMAKPEFKVKF